MVFERRSRIASVYHVILTPCMSGRLIEVGKNWLLASAFREYLSHQLCSSPFAVSRGALLALLGLFSGFVECLKESASFWSKSLTVCSDSVPAEVPFYASSLEFVECLREFRRFAKCAPPLNEFLHFFLVILRWESFNFSRFR